jgi:hypothetical protein
LVFVGVVFFRGLRAIAPPSASLESAPGRPPSLWEPRPRGDSVPSCLCGSVGRPSLDLRHLRNLRFPPSGRSPQMQQAAPPSRRCPLYYTTLCQGFRSKSQQIPGFLWWRKWPFSRRLPKTPPRSPPRRPPLAPARGGAVGHVGATRRVARFSFAARPRPCLPVLVASGDLGEGGLPPAQAVPVGRAYPCAPGPVAVL